MKQILEQRVQAIAVELLNGDITNNLQGGLLSGKLGVALFFMYYSRFSGEEAYGNRAYELIEEVISGSVFDVNAYNLNDGMAGIGWLLEHCNASGFLEVDTNDLFGVNDELLFTKMIDELKLGKYDYILGGLGIFLYFLGKPASLTVDSWLAKAVDVLEETSIQSDGLVRWAEFDFLGLCRKEGRINLGLSHGIPGILTILSKAYVRAVSQDKCIKLIRGTSDYLLSVCDLDSKGRAVYPNVDVAGQDLERTSRLAWCYGDLSVCLALFSANQVLKDDVIDGVVRQLLTRSIARTDFRETSVRDIALCHGAAGIGHIFHKFGLRFEDPAFYQAADYWFDRNLDGSLEKELDAGFLEGKAGVGLAYLSYLDPENSGWDELLLMQ